MLNGCGDFMEEWMKKLPDIARKETLPEIPKRIVWKSRFFGKNQLLEYIGAYYQEESERRVPFYLPYLYRKEIFRYLCRTAGLQKKQVNLVLIDGGDARIDCFLSEFLEDLNYLTIITERTAYFESLQERAFQEMGLLIDLWKPWEEKNLKGNMVWDFTSNLQKSDCYPENSVCFAPHKKMWKWKELAETSSEVTIVFLKEIEIGVLKVSPSLAESLLVPPDFPFRETRCNELKKWCHYRRWMIRLSQVKCPQSLEKP